MCHGRRVVIPCSPLRRLRTVATLLLLAGLGGRGAAEPINRHALVTRHNPVIRTVDPQATLTVGNGGFAFGGDITGLQTFAAYYHDQGVPTETLARWCWVTDPNPQGYTLADAGEALTEADGRTVTYPTRTGTPAADWLRRNPRLHPLGLLALEWDRPDGRPLAPTDIEAPEETLDLWRGILTSRFRLGGVPVQVQVACDPGSDTLAVSLVSELVRAGRLRVRLAFPRGHDLTVKNTPALDWSHPEEHTSQRVALSRIVRTVGTTRYAVQVDFTGSARVQTGNALDGRLCQTGAHTFRLLPERGAPELTFTLRFSPGEPISATAQPTPAAVFAASAAHWEQFWRTGGAVDFAGSTDPRAAELERRVVLSQYLTAVQLGADVPPQESGLTCNTWYGKHHTEMIWWHTAHFALWGRAALLARNLAWYQAQLPAACALARSRGLRGARWAKMTGPELRESPGGNPLIVWNQPHPIYLAELLYRDDPTAATLARYRDLVAATADGLAAMVHLDPARGTYTLGPPLWSAQELHDPATSRNPAFELAYWRWALTVAQQWRLRLGQARDPRWDDVIARLAPLPQRGGLYVALESAPDTWDNPASRHDHPVMLAPLGLLPGGPTVDRATMARTLDAVLTRWDWATKIWGWDYPLIAMTATRLGRPATALDLLLRDGPNNHYLPNGHCPQRSDVARPAAADGAATRPEIAAYLPANGALLATVALMVAGWDGCPEPFPGFPRDGTWHIRAEGLHPLP